MVSVSGASEAVTHNPSIERTALSWLRQPEAAAHVERYESSPGLENAS